MEESWPVSYIENCTGYSQVGDQFSDESEVIQIHILYLLEVITFLSFNEDNNEINCIYLELQSSFAGDTDYGSIQLQKSSPSLPLCLLRDNLIKFGCSSCLILQEHQPCLALSKPWS